MKQCVFLLCVRSIAIMHCTAAIFPKLVACTCICQPCQRLGPMIVQVHSQHVHVRQEKEKTKRLTACNLKACLVFSVLGECFLLAKVAM